MTKFKSVQDVFKNKKRWTKLTAARDKYGYPVDLYSHKACKWCLGGALELVYNDKESIPTAKFKIVALINRNRAKPISVVAWNDAPKRTIEQVRKLVKRAGV